MANQHNTHIKYETYVLSNGVHIPKIGFGTWKIKEGDEAYHAVSNALQIGYRHIDTATVYRNEKSVGRAIKDSKLPREDIFVTTKLPAEIKGYDSTFEQFNMSLTKLGLTYIDLYLIHAPWPWNDIGRDCTKGNIESWQAIIKLYQEKKIRAIGVSNFGIDDIQSLITATGFVPHVNQIPFYVGKPQDELRAFCREKGILIEAYSPLMSGLIFKMNVVNDLAKKYNVTPAQIALRYTLEQGTLPLPKSTHTDRMQENMALDFAIDEEDIRLLSSVKIKSSSRFL